MHRVRQCGRWCEPLGTTGDSRHVLLREFVQEFVRLPCSLCDVATCTEPRLGHLILVARMDLQLACSCAGHDACVGGCACARCTCTDTAQTPLWSEAMHHDQVSRCLICYVMTSSSAANKAQTHSCTVTCYHIPMDSINQLSGTHVRLLSSLIKQRCPGQGRNSVNSHCGGPLTSFYVYPFKSLLMAWLAGCAADY